MKFVRATNLHRKSRGNIEAPVHGGQVKGTDSLTPSQVQSADARSHSQKLRLRVSLMGLSGVMERYVHLLRWTVKAAAFPTVLACFRNSSSPFRFHSLRISPNT